MDMLGSSYIRQSTLISATTSIAFFSSTKTESEKKFKKSLFFGRSVLSENRHQQFDVNSFYFPWPFWAIQIFIFGVSCIRVRLSFINMCYSLRPIADFICFFFFWILLLIQLVKWWLFASHSHWAHMPSWKILDNDLLQRLGWITATRPILAVEIDSK